MALVVFLRGINVGGYRNFRPTVLARQLTHLDAVSIGAAGTFVVRHPIAQAQLRRELVRRLPFEAAITICQGRHIIDLTSQDFFADHPVRPDIVRFVSILSRRPRAAPQLPMSLPFRGRWLVNVLAHDDRFVVGLYRRHISVIRYLGELDRVFGVAITTRNWNTMMAVAAVLDR